MVLVRKLVRQQKGGVHVERPDRTPILHVENDTAVARSVARVLRHRGLCVERVTGCRDARELARSYDVGIFDLDLDDGDGVTLAAELTRRGLVRRAIFYTASTDRHLCALASGFGLVVSKAHGAGALADALGEDIRCTQELR